jgi:hypothetical protein
VRIVNHPGHLVDGVVAGAAIHMVRNGVCKEEKLVASSGGLTHCGCGIPRSRKRKNDRKGLP